MITKAQYVEYLISTPVNYTGTNLAAHLDGVSHDQITDFLAQEEYSSQHLWELAKSLIDNTSDAFLILDDSVQDKRYARSIENAYRQYSGNVHGIVNGIGVVNLVHGTDEGGVYPIDYRVYDPELDGKTKNDHFLAMLKQAFMVKQIAASWVLFDSWYGSATNLKYIHRAGRIFLTTLKSNRLISVDKEQGYIHLDALTWTSEQLQQGHWVRLKEVPFAVRLFKLVAPDGDIEWLITNNDDSTFSIDGTSAQQKRRWLIEPFHRELKQLTGSERCQCRKAQSQRNHLACCYHAWLTLKVKAQELRTTLYQVRLQLFRDYLRSELRNPHLRALT
jgi:hypothetical protein